MYDTKYGVPKSLCLLDLGIEKAQGGKRMMDYQQPERGELWGFKLPNSMSENVGIVLATNGQIITILRIIEEQNEKHDITINYMGQMYGCSRMLQYLFPQSLTGYKRSLTNDEFSDVLQKITNSLELNDYVDLSKNTSTEMVPVSVSVSAPEYVANDSAKDAEILTLKTQLNVYKDMYESLIQQMMHK